MENIIEGVSKLYRRFIWVGIFVFAINVLMLIVGLVAIIPLTDIDLQNRLLVIALGTVLVFSVSIILIIYLLRDTIVTAITEEQSKNLALKRYERSNNQLQVAAEIAREATAEANLQGLLDRAIHLVCERFHFHHAAIYLVDKEKNRAVTRASHGGKTGQHTLEIDKESVVGLVISTGQSRIVRDTHTDTYYNRNSFLSETHSELAIPLVGGCDSDYWCIRCSKPERQCLSPG